jgi:hypothetical protein
MKGLGKFRNPMTSSRIEIMNAQLVAECLNQLHHCVFLFGLKRYKMIGGLRKLHNEELHNLYSSPGIVRKMKSMKM